jgi:hypothetical protein
MREPQLSKPDPVILMKDRQRLTLCLALLPVLVLGGALVGNNFSGAAALVHPTVNLADRVVREKAVAPKIGVLAPEDLALERGGEHEQELLSDAKSIRRRFRIGCGWFGAWIGAVVGIKLISLCLQRRRTDYEPARGDCVACARCFDYCPKELTRRGIKAELAPVLEAQAVNPESVDVIS